MKSFKIRCSEPSLMLRRVIEVSVEGDKKKSKKISVVIPNIPLNPDGTFVVLPIDQFSGKSFMKNSCGFPMNDIMAYEDTQNDSIARAVLNRINVVNNGKPEDLSVQEQFDRIVPSNWSSPAEYLSVCEKFGTMAYNKQMDALRSQQTANVDDNPPDHVVEVNPE